MPKQFCIRGHDTYVVGRTQRMCRECRRMNDRARYHRRRPQQIAWFNRVGFLKQMNRRVDAALQKLEALLG